MEVVQLSEKLHVRDPPDKDVYDLGLSNLSHLPGGYYVF